MEAGMPQNTVSLYAVLGAVKRRRMAMVRLLTVFLTFTNILALYSVLTISRTSNDECLWLPQKAASGTKEIRFSDVKVNGVAWNAGIRNGDILKKIEGVPISNTFMAQGIIDRIPAGDYARYTVGRGSDEFQASVLIKKLTNSRDIANAILALSWLLIGFIVYQAKPDGAIQKYFFRVGVALSVIFSVLITVPFLSTVASSLVFRIYFAIWLLLACLQPVWIFLFFMHFPIQYRVTRRPWFNPAVYGLSILLYGYQMYMVLTEFGGVVDGLTLLRVSGGGLVGIFGNAAYYTGLGLIITGYMQVRKTPARQPVQVIMYTYIAGLLGILFVSLIAPRIGGIIFNTPEYYTPILLIALLPLSFAYAIFKYQLMDVGSVLKNTLVYSSGTIAVGALYLLLVYLVGRGAGAVVPAVYSGLVSAFVFLIFALAFQPARQRVQEMLTTRFYPEQAAFENILLNLNTSLSKTVGMEGVLETVSATVSSALKPSVFGILVKNAEDAACLVKPVGIAHSGAPLAFNPASLLYLLRSKAGITQPVLEQSDFARVFPADAALLLSWNVYTIIPLINNSRVVGFLLFGLKFSGSTFSGKELELLLAIGNQTAVALENARLYLAETEKIKLEHDLELARRIQTGLLPRELPAIQGVSLYGEMISAMHVGGDYYDIVPLAEDKFFVIVADVSGKGLAASLYMAKLQTLFWVVAETGASPKQLLVELNRKMYGFLEREAFVTVSLALVDVGRQEMRFCRAGHLPLYVAESGNATEVRPKGIGIGLSSGDVFAHSLVEEVIPLKPGQVYAFFTDGITESVDEKGVLLDERPLIDLLAAANGTPVNELASRIWEHLRTVRRGASPHDDMTMVLFKLAS